MKNINYTNPEIEIVLFDEEDVMTANPSNISYGGDTGILDGEADSWFK